MLTLVVGWGVMLGKKERGEKGVGVGKKRRGEVNYR